MSAELRSVEGWSSFFWAEHVHKHGGEFVTCDVSRLAIDECRTALSGFKNVSTIVGDGVDLVRDPYDLIYIDCAERRKILMSACNLQTKVLCDDIVLETTYSKVFKDARMTLFLGPIQRKDVGIPFTFGIITDGTEDSRKRVEDIKGKVDSLGIREIETMVVSDTQVEIDGVMASIARTSSIAGKKNLIARLAKYENVVLSHDYVIPNDDWYRGWVDFGENYSAATCRVYGSDGARYLDWTLAPYQTIRNALSESGANEWELMLPYEGKLPVGLSRYMYLPGYYFVAKKALLNQMPIDDDGLKWNGHEDVEWSGRVVAQHELSLVIGSSVRLFGKTKTNPWRVIPDSTLKKTTNRLLFGTSAVSSLQ